MTDKQLREKLEEMAADMNGMNTDVQSYVLGGAQMSWAAHK